MKKKAKHSASETRKATSTSSESELSSNAYAPRVDPRDRSSSIGKVRELSWADFDRFVRALARSISKTFTPDAVVGVAHGGVFVGGALASALSCEFFPVRISRRSRDNRVHRSPRLHGQMPAELSGKRILIVDDVASSGNTLQLAHKLAIKAGAKEALTATLVTRAGGFQPGWTALSSAQLVVFPWDYEPVTEDARFDVDPEKAGA